MAGSQGRHPLRNPRERLPTDQSSVIHATGPMAELPKWKHPKTVPSDQIPEQPSCNIGPVEIMIMTTNEHYKPVAPKIMVNNPRSIKTGRDDLSLLIISVAIRISSQLFVPAGRIHRSAARLRMLHHLPGESLSKIAANLVLPDDTNHQRPFPPEILRLFPRHQCQSLFLDLP